MLEQEKIWATQYKSSNGRIEKASGLVIAKPIYFYPYGAFS